MAHPHPGDDTLLDELEPEARRELERNHYVRVGDDLVWIEPDGRVRREAADGLYYLATGRGVFRVSRLDGRVVEV